eukprot:8976351-Alexandrium_andersonii.AAC.1
MCIRDRFEESSDADVLVPLLDATESKPEYQGCQRLQVAVVYGACASVLPEGRSNGHAVKPSEGARAGASYLAADGGRVPNRGEAQLSLVAKERHRCRTTFPVADVKRPVLA